MTILKRLKVLAAKIETTSGTAESLSATDAAFNAYNINIQSEIDMNAREGQGGFGMLPSIVGGYKGKLTFRIDASWDGTATEPAWADTFLPACGLVKSSQIFRPKNEFPGSNVKTLTLAVYDGKIKSLRGASGTFKLVCPTGKDAYFDFEFTGIWVPPTDGSILAPTYPSDLALRYANSTTTYNSVALCLSNLTLDLGNEIAMRECATDVTGYGGTVITKRNPKITGDPEAKLVATRDPDGQLLAMSESTLTWDLDGPTNSKITIAAPKAQVIKNGEGDRNGITTDEIEWQCNRNGSTQEQEISLTFTAAT